MLGSDSILGRMRTEDGFPIAVLQSGRGGWRSDVRSHTTWKQALPE